MSATVLVSYVPDEIDEADDDEDSGESLPSIFNIHNFQGVSCILSFYCIWEIILRWKTGP